jgi:hypothetical protein
MTCPVSGNPSLMLDAERCGFTAQGPMHRSMRLPIQDRLLRRVTNVSGGNRVESGLTSE